MMNFKWKNESSITKTGNRIEIFAPPKTDYFCGYDHTDENGPQPEIVTNAPYYYTDVEGDFIVRVKVTPNFESTYDACALLVMEDDTHWVKACFEATDFNTHAVVSVVTDHLSDDANGVNLEAETCWLQICRVGNEFGMQYSLDGKNFYMMRYFYLNVGKSVKVGLVAQSPMGKGGMRIFEDLTIFNKSVEDIRAGV